MPPRTLLRSSAAPCSLDRHCFRFPLPCSVLPVYILTLIPALGSPKNLTPPPKHPPQANTYTDNERLSSTLFMHEFLPKFLSFQLRKSKHMRDREVAAEAEKEAVCAMYRKYVGRTRLLFAHVRFMVCLWWPSSSCSPFLLLLSANRSA